MHRSICDRVCDKSSLSLYVLSVTNLNECIRCITFDAETNATDTHTAWQRDARRHVHSLSGGEGNKSTSECMRGNWRCMRRASCMTRRPMSSKNDAEKNRRLRPRCKVTVKYKLLSHRVSNGAWGPSHRGSALAHRETTTTTACISFVYLGRRPSRN